MIINNIKSPSEFAMEIEKFVKNTNSEYVDAVVLYAEKHQIEIETLASMIKQSPNLKAKIQAECEDKNLLTEKSAKLPL